MKVPSDSIPWTWVRLKRNGWFQVAAMLGVLIVAGWLADWNEYRSPWGRDIQAAKLAILKAKLCD